MSAKALPPLKHTTTSLMSYGKSNTKLPPINDPYTTNANKGDSIVNIMDPLGMSGPKMNATAAVV